MASQDVDFIDLGYRVVMSQDVDSDGWMMMYPTSQNGEASEQYDDSLSLLSFPNSDIQSQPQLLGGITRESTNETMPAAKFTPRNAMEHNYYAGGVAAIKNQHQMIQSVHAYTSTDEAATAAKEEERRQKKRKSDKEYRLRQKEEKEALHQKIAGLEEQLRLAKDTKKKLSHKPDSPQDDSDKYCTAEFSLDFPDDNARGGAMKIIGQLPGVTMFTMNMKDKKLTLQGKGIDNIYLQSELNKICNVELLFYSKEDEEKNEGEKTEESKAAFVVRNSAHVAQHSGPITYMTPCSYPFPPANLCQMGGGAARESFSFTKAAVLFTILALALLCGRYAFYLLSGKFSPKCKLF